jgi:hypothetical protein
MLSICVHGVGSAMCRETGYSRRGVRMEILPLSVAVPQIAGFSKAFRCVHVNIIIFTMPQVVTGIVRSRVTAEIVRFSFLLLPLIEMVS